MREGDILREAEAFLLQAVPQAIEPDKDLPAMLLKPMGDPGLGLLGNTGMIRQSQRCGHDAEASLFGDGFHGGPHGRGR